MPSSQRQRHSCNACARSAVVPPAAAYEWRRRLGSLSPRRWPPPGVFEQRQQSGGGLPGWCARVRPRSRSGRAAPRHRGWAPLRAPAAASMPPSAQCDGAGGAASRRRALLLALGSGQLLSLLVTASSAASTALAGAVATARGRRAMQGDRVWARSAPPRCSSRACGGASASVVGWGCLVARWCARVRALRGMPAQGVVRPRSAGAPGTAKEGRVQGVGVRRAAPVASWSGAGRRARALTIQRPRCCR